MGFDYEIQYEKGQENVAANALSRIQGSEVLFIALSIVDSNLATLIKTSYEQDLNFMAIIKKLQQQEHGLGFVWSNNFLRKHGKIIVGPDLALRKKIISWQHNFPEGGHGGRELTTGKRVKSLFWWLAWP